jgi:hypothetical protein
MGKLQKPFFTVKRIIDRRMIAGYNVGYIAG